MTFSTVSYLQQHDAVDAYLAEQDCYDEQTKQELEARHADAYRELRQRLLDRNRTKVT